jgi:hypothetical protein
MLRSVAVRNFNIIINWAEEKAMKEIKTSTLKYRNILSSLIPIDKCTNRDYQNNKNIIDIFWRGSLSNPALLNSLLVLISGLLNLSIVLFKPFRFFAVNRYFFSFW